VEAPRSFVDLHVHSSASFDSLADPVAIVSRAARLGLTHVAITDHERIDGAIRARDAQHPDVRVIVGQEVRTREGDLIALFVESAVAPGASAVDTAAAVHAQGGIVGLPHPFDRFRFSGGRRAAQDDDLLNALASVVDYVEVHNARAYGRANPDAAAFAARHGLPGVAASDAHRVGEVAIASTVLQGSFDAPEELLALLPSAGLVRGRTAYVSRLWTPVAKLIQHSRGNRRIEIAAASPAPRHEP
jgi:predicted metal-dependent phosphoesterase TrpH